jgi:hypothetical protein
MMVKLNWGAGILAILIVFFIIMSVMAYIAFNQRIDLVTKNYYEKELQYQGDIAKQQNELNLKNKVQIEQVPGKLSFNFPVEEVGSKITGDIKLYRASDSRDDKQFQLKVDSLGKCQIPLTKVKKGLWTIIVNWNAKGHDYITQKKFIVE